MTHLPEDAALEDSVAEDSDFERRARLAHIRQSLEAPVRAVLGYQEILLLQARQMTLGAAFQDLDRMLTSARALDALVDRAVPFTALPEVLPRLPDIESALCLRIVYPQFLET